MLVRLFQLLRLFLLVLSFFGYLYYLSPKIKAEFAVGIIFSSVAGAVFFAGILNLLPEISLLILLCGIFLFFLSLRRKYPLRPLLSFGTGFFIIASVFFLFILFGLKLTHYDNFSHWGLAVKLMLSSDRFPNFMDTIVQFQSYPLGSASFIYYISRISGINAEWLYMYAQAVLMLGLCLGLFAFCGKLGNLLSLATAAILLCSNVNFIDLLVDTLLPVAAVGAFSYCLWCHIEAKDARYYLYLIPHLIFLVTIKNSGLLFAVLLIIFSFPAYRRCKNNRLYFYITWATPFLSVLLWDKHVDMVYFDGFSSKHSMSLSNFSSVFGGKTQQEISETVSLFKEQVFSPENTFFWLLLFIIVFFSLSFFIKSRSVLQIRVLLCFSLAAYLVYQVGLLCMYLFSMPINNHLALSGYDRYHSSILIFVGGMLSLSLLLYLRDISINKQKRGGFADFTALFLVFFFVVTACFSLRPSFEYYCRQNIDGSERVKFEKLLTDHHVLPMQKYYFLVDDSYVNDGFYNYLGRYLLLTVDSAVYNIDSLASLGDLGSYGYLIAIDPQQEQLDYIYENYGVYSQVINLNEY